MFSHRWSQVRWECYHLPVKGPQESHRTLVSKVLLIYLRFDREMKNSFEKSWFHEMVVIFKTKIELEHDKFSAMSEISRVLDH